MPLADKIERLRNELRLADTISMSATIATAKRAIGVKVEGSLSEQADQLLKAIGLATQPTSPAAASSAAQSAMQRAQSKELADAKADLAVTKSALSTAVNHLKTKRRNKRTSRILP